MIAHIQTDTALESEMALAGALLRWPAEVLPICKGLSEESFHSEPCRAVFRAVMMLKTVGNLTPAAVRNELRDDVADITQIEGFASLCASVNDAPAHARQIRDAERGRTLSEIGEQLEKAPHQERRPPSVEKYEAALKDWPEGERHTQILRAANLARAAGIPPDVAEEQIRQALPRPPNPPSEIESAVAKAYSDTSTMPKPKPPTPKRERATVQVGSSGGVVSFFKSKNHTTGSTMPLREVLDGIKSGRWAALVKPVRDAVDAGNNAAKDAAKKRLLGFTPAGTFSPRMKVGLVAHSGLVVADLDKLPSAEDAAKIRDALAQDAHVRAAFISPSGRGVKALVRVELCANHFEHEAAFDAMVEYFSDQHGILLDTSGRDVSRLCFVSLDPGAFIRDGEAVPLRWRAGNPDAVEATNELQPYSTRSWDELAEMNLTPPDEIWGGWCMGALAVIFGQGGLGKSRVALNLARNQVLGLHFAGLPTAAKPLRHLFVGSENSIHRLQRDVRRMNAGLTAEQVATLGQHIRMATLEGAEDSYISLASPVNVERWRLTVEAHKPDVLWVDPWGDVLEGEANSDEDARATISALRRILRKVDPEAGLCILAHSRTGASNILQAIGFDAANFGKGSKALYSAARCVWNLAPGDESESPPLVMCHAKSNDSRKHEPIAVRLEPESMTYNVDEGFDFDQWQAEVAAAAQGKRGTKKSTTMTKERAAEVLGDKVCTASEVKQALRDNGASRDGAADIMQQMILAGVWEQWKPPALHAPTFVGMPDALKRKRAEVTESLQKKLPI